MQEINPLSIVKIKVSNEHSHPNNKIKQVQQPQVNTFKKSTINENTSPLSSQNKYNDHLLNKFSKFYKKEIKTHERNIKKNPRIKLIQNTQKLIHTRQTSFEKYILHSTKRLKIISQYSDSHPESRPASRNVSLDNSNHFISVPQPFEKNHSFTLNDKLEQRRRKSQQNNNRIFRGITSRDSNVKTGRLSLQLQKYRSHHNHQNEQDFVQHKKINLYHNLIYGGQFQNNVFPMPLMQSLGGDYSKIDRSQTPAQYVHRGKTRQHERIARENFSSGFPTKKIEGNEPQVLTIHIRKPQNKLRHSLGNRDSRQYYQPRPVPSSNISIFKRPNTTFSHVRNRRDSEIEPW